MRLLHFIRRMVAPVALMVLTYLTLASCSAVAHTAPAWAAESANADPLAQAARLQPQTGTETEGETSAVTVHWVNMGASNAFLIETEKGFVLVDAGMPFSERAVLRKMKQLGRDDLNLIFITHAHLDHYGAANALREKTDAPIAIHRDDAATMALGRTELGEVRDWQRTSEAALPFIEPLLRATPVKADILLEDGDSLAKFGVDAYVLHTPGHTPGSSTLVVEDRFALVGDLLASSNGDLHAQRSYAADWQEVADSIDRVKALDLELIFPGHGSKPITGEQLETIKARFVEEE